MKKFFVNPVIVLTLIASMFFVSSCDLTGEIDQADLIGTWDMGDTSVDAKVGPVSLKQALKVALQLPDQAIDLLVDELMADFGEIETGTITFNEDNSYALVQGDLGEEGTWELDEDKLHMILEGETMDEDPLTVRSLSSSAAVVAWEEDEDLEVEGQTFNVTIVIEMNLSKQ